MKLKNIITIISFLIITCISMNAIMLSSTKTAHAEWVTLNGIPNGIQEAEVRTSVIIQKGVHNAADDDTIRYKTDGYYMSLTPFDTDIKINSGSNASRDKKFDDVKITNEQVIGTQKYTTYEVKRTNFMKAVTALGITGETLKAGPKTVYMSNVFDIVKGSNDAIYSGKNNIFGYQEMLSQVSWSSATIDFLRGYYNFQYVLSPITYKLEIRPVYMDGNTPKPITGAKNSSGSNVPDILKLMRIIETENVSYSLSSANRTLTKGEAKYTYKNWYYEYTQESGGKKKTSPSSGSIEFEAPAAEEDSTLTVYLVYEPQDAPVIPTPPVDEEPDPELPPEVVAPEPEAHSIDFTEVLNTGSIKADVRESERFVATQGVPTTESLYTQVFAKKYLLGYTFVKKVGIKYYPVRVTKNYILQWSTATPEEAGGGEPITETVPVTQEITVARAFGYWEIEQLEVYKIGSATVYNYALPDGSVTMTPNYSYYSPPTVNVSHSSSENDHIIPPAEVTTGITLPSETIMASAGYEAVRPSIPREDFTLEAYELTGMAKVKSDYLTFNGTTVISSAVTDTEAPDINLNAIPQCYEDINNNVLYKPDNVIEATKKNGNYPSHGSLTYTKVAKINSYRPDNPEYPIEGLNNVVIHTPVVCNPIINADNNKYVQLITPTANCTQLVLDPDDRLSDFTVHISNTGLHSNKLGYYTRDFSSSLRDPNVSYISKANSLLKNQVKFPFDVYIDQGTAYDSSDDAFIKENTWITIDRSTPRFYLPMTVNEGVYTVDFRTIAVNGEPYINKTEEFANTQINNYVATNTLQVEVSGRIYGLNIYDISDYPLWEEPFRVKNSFDFKKDRGGYADGTKLSGYNAGRYYNYTVGTNDQYGNDTGRSNKYTFPLVDGSHPKYKNVGILKTGYLFRFSLETTGNMYSDANMVTIKPSFYYVDKDGKNRQAVDLYYTENISGKTRNLIKVGSSLDQVNLKTISTGDIHLGIPVTELKQTARLRGEKYGAFIGQYAPMFNFSYIRLGNSFRTYVNNAYLNEIKSYSSYTDVKDDKISENDILKRMQRWYGQYYVPNEVHAAPKGYDVLDYSDKYGIDYDENFWLTEGYIIVNFTIETVGEDSTRRLSYINATNYQSNSQCSMWLMEGPVITKESYKGATFHFYAGDVMIYHVNKRMTDDYETGAVY